MPSKDSVQLSLKRAAPDQRLSVGLIVRWFALTWLQLFFVLPVRLFIEFIAFRWFSPVVHHVGRPLAAHFLIKVAQFNVTRGVPAQIRILVNGTRSYAIAHATPAFLKAGKGWARKVEVNGTAGWWISNPQHDQAKADVVVYFIHGGAFLFDSGANSHEFFLSVIQDIKAKHGLNASVFALDYKLPPEYCYPSQLIEALAGYHYLVNGVGIPENKVIVAGDSAGGNLAEALLLHLARPADVVNVPEELGPTPNQPGGVLLVSPYHNLYSASHSLKTNSTFDLLDSTVAARAAFSYIGAADRLPASYQFKMPSLSPLFLVMSPQRDLPHPAEHLKGVFGFSDIERVELFASPYVNPAVQRDASWWKEAMPGGGRTMVTWGGIEILADDCEELYKQLDQAGVEPAKLYKELGIHDWVLHDWSLPLSWRTKTKGAEGSFYYGRDRVVDLLNLVASSAKSASSASQRKALESAHVPSAHKEAKTTARPDTNDDDESTSTASSKQQQQQQQAFLDRATAPKAPSPSSDSSYAHVAADDSDVAPDAPVVAEGEQATIISVEEQKERAEREEEAHDQAPATGRPSFADVAADNEHVAPDAPVVAEGEQAKIVSVEEQKEQAKREEEAHKQAPTTRGPSFAAVAADDSHVDASAPVVAEGEGATIDRSRAAEPDHDDEPQPSAKVETQPAQTDSEPASSPTVSHAELDSPQHEHGREPSHLSAEAPAFEPAHSAHEPEQPATTSAPSKSAKKKQKQKAAKAKAKAAATSSLSSGPAPVPAPSVAAAAAPNGAGSYAAIAAHDDHVGADAPVVAEGEGDTIHRRE
ncbi:hypothetical protein JCM8208_005718 [Rhodotorula glutinis]